MMPELYATVDLSENNGFQDWLPIDWPLLLRSNPTVGGQPLYGVRTRAALGALRPDYAWATNWQALRASDKFQGAYQYCLPDTAPTIIAHAKNHARFLWGLIEAQGGAHADDFPPALDIEVANGLTPTQLTQWAETAWDELRILSGTQPRVYSDVWFLETYLKPLIGQVPLWVAAIQPQAPALPHVEWQWGWTRLPGIQTKVDADWYTGPLPG